MNHHWPHHSNMKQISDMIFSAVADQEPLEDINTITIKGEFAERVEQQALDNLMVAKVALTPRSVFEEMDTVFASKTVFVQESVYHTEHGISVVVDAELIDDVAMHRVVKLVADALDKLDGQYGTVAVGQPVTFSKSDLHWLNTH